ncbi:MAG: sulfurtransferase TusA family protein [Actinobacteria bacterium]|nr:sulfurtransferase TusA family protein [Actinomycetota bacterium]
MTDHATGTTPDGPPDGAAGDERAPDTEVDARGLACPLPVIELARAVREAPVGALVRLAATDEAAEVDVPVWCRMQRHRLLRRATADDGAFLFDIEVAGS